MTDKTKENLRILSIGMIGFIITLLLGGCSTTSYMRCDKYVGPEKEACLEKYKQQIDNMDYRGFRGGEVNPFIGIR